MTNDIEIEQRAKEYRNSQDKSILETPNKKQNYPDKKGLLEGENEK